MHTGLPQLEQFLQQYADAVSDIRPIGEGWWSQAFSFLQQGNKRVIRIGRHPDDFRKDAVAYRHWNLAGISIPAVYDIGHYDADLYYCISEFIAGTPSDQVMEGLAKEAREALAPLLLQPLDMIHRLDTSAWTGWGATGPDGHGLFSSWPAYLLAIHNSKNPVSWQHLAQTTWLEASLLEALIERMESYFPFLPVTKQVLHGDYGFDNLLVGAAHEITGVLDWAETTLGDGLYDLIHMNEPWVKREEEPDYLRLWQAGATAAALQHFEQRKACYRIHYTLLHLHIHTVRGEYEAYKHIADWAKQHLL